MKEMLSNALSGKRGEGLFSVPPDSGKTVQPSNASYDNFALPSAITPSSATGGLEGVTEAQRRATLQKVGSRKQASIEAT